jgi:hypothetical protein
MERRLPAGRYAGILPAAWKAADRPAGSRRSVHSPNLRKIRGGSIHSRSALPSGSRRTP